MQWGVEVAGGEKWEPALHPEHPSASPSGNTSLLT